ncbi:MAG: HAD family hydrolase [Candidatus Zixiibacteriota bacterium]
MEKLNPQAVIFDLGSTLIEYETMPWSEMNVLCARSVQRSMHRQGFDVPDAEEFFKAFERIKDEYRARAAQSLVEWTIVEAAEELLRSWGIDTDEQLLDRFFDAYYAPISEKIYPYDDVLETLQKAKQHLLVIGLISNTVFPERVHWHELRRFGIASFLDFAVFSSTFGLRKPHPDIFLKAANLAGYAPSECVYVGDRYVEDIEGPQGVGMPAILKLWDGRQYPNPLPDTVRTIRSLSELDRHLLYGRDPRSGSGTGL